MSAIRTLAVHTGGIGDFLLACPALIHLAEEGPLELLGRADRLAVAVAAGIAKAAHDMDCAGFDSVFTEPNDRLRGLLARFDRCVVWMRDEGTIARAIRRCGVADVHVLPGLPPKDWPDHASCYYLECLGYGAVKPLRLDIAPGNTRRDVIIHPGSGGCDKSWPLAQFEAVVDALVRQGRSVTWCLGPAEEAVAVPPGTALLRLDSLVDLAQELAAARLYLGNDSGITHLAAAVGCRTVVIFGPTNPRVWAPLGEHVTVVQGFPWPEAAAVLAQIECL